MSLKCCPKCKSNHFIKAGLIRDKQRYKCKSCQYYFTVGKAGNSIDPYYVTKSLQLYLEGISFREIERVLGVSHVSVNNWVKRYKITKVENLEYRPTYKILSAEELSIFFSKKTNLKNSGFIINELGDKYMLIKWDRFKK